MADEEAIEALFAHSSGICGTRVALEESHCDRRVESIEDHGGARPECVEFGLEAIGQRDLGFHEVLASAGERSQRLRLIRVGHQHSETMVVGAGKLGQTEGVEGVGLSAGGTEARPGGLQLVGMDREHHEACFQQTLDQNTIRTFDGDAFHLKLDKQLTHPTEVSLVVGETPLQERLAICSQHAHLVRILGPVQPGTSIHRDPPSLAYTCSGESDRELPLRMLVGQRSAEPAQRPVAACWPPHTAGRRRLTAALSFMGLAVLVLSRRLSGSLRTDPVWSKLPPRSTSTSGRRSTHRLPYDRSGPPLGTEGKFFYRHLL
jgi:hypothetical protein